MLVVVLPSEPGHADDPAGADLEKGLHFRGKLRPCGTQRLQLRLSRVQTGRSEGHIAGDARQIIIAEVQLRAEALQLEHLRSSFSRGVRSQP